MDPIDKLKVLSEDSQYDIACACGTGNDVRRTRGTEGKWLITSGRNFYAYRD